MGETVKYSIRKIVDESELRMLLDNEYHMEVDKKCPHELEIHDLSKQYERMNLFIREAEPLLDYVKSEKERNDKRSKLYEKLTEQLLGWGILAVVGWIGTAAAMMMPFIVARIKSYLGIV